ncbi:MAG: hypothetical protein EPO67_17645 [Reyranella sp.]|nr:MAG: hypothetical protein EPO67_17645 [Reyranella sp.]
MMQKETAARLLEAALSLDPGINRLDSLISRLDDPAEKAEFIEALGNILQILTRDFVFRIVREHPELDPDK